MLSLNILWMTLVFVYKGFGVYRIGKAAIIIEMVQINETLRSEHFTLHQYN